MSLDRRKLGALWLLFFSILLIVPTTLSSAQDDVIPFVVRTASGPGKLDPLDAYDSESIETIMQVVEGLYIYNYTSPEMEPIPNLAADMGTWSLDGEGNLTILTIPLLTGVTFHDGSKFNASAVKWNFDRLQYWTYGLDVDSDNTTLETHPLGTASKTLFAQNGVPILNHSEIVDEYTVRFHLNLESVIWEKLLAFVACSIVRPDADYVYGNTFFNRIDINEELVGTGPFMLTEYNFDHEVVFDYNPDYHMTWGADHIEQMIYLIVPDDVTASIKVLNHEIHWGAVDPDYDDQFEADPALVEVARKASVVYFISMNTKNILWEYRYASSFAWNHSHFLDETLGGRHYELHVPIPDGMQYHYSNFEGEPYYNLTKAREILLSSSNSQIQGNITLSGLNSISSREEWRLTAESPNPIGWLNYTVIYYSSWGDWGCYGSPSALDNLVFPQLQDNLKDIGIRLDMEFICIYWQSENWESVHQQGGYYAGGWGPDYYDPINMIQPLYGINQYSNVFGFINTTWNQKLIDTYSAVGEDRRSLFYEIQSDFCTIHIPSIYILQLGGTISFNRDFIEETSITDMLNIMSDYYWFNVRFTPPVKKIPGYDIFLFCIISFVACCLIVMKMKRIK